MTKCIANDAVKIPIDLYGVVDSVTEKFLSDLLPPHVYVELKAKRGNNIRRIADAILSPTELCHRYHRGRPSACACPDHDAASH